MSGQGAPTMTTPKAEGASVAIVASLWHTELMDALIGGAERACAEAGANTSVLRVPGSFELPLAAQRAAERFDAVVALGVVIKGETPHFDYVCSGVTQGIMSVMLNTNKPIGFGVLTCDTEAQALARCGGADAKEDKGYESAQAALALLEI